MRKGVIKRNDRCLVVIEPNGRISVRILDGVSAELKELQELVGGNIEVVPAAKCDGLLMIVNEEGAISAMKMNRMATLYAYPGEVLFGTAVLAMQDGEDIVGMSDSMALMFARSLAELWKEMET